MNLRSGNPTINNGWKETFTVDVFVYDAGTDSGTNYTSTNAPTQPSFDNITLANGLPTNGHRMATMTFTFKSSLLSTTEFESVESARLFPNPVSASETVSILNSSRLKRIDVYDTLGKHVKFIVLSGTSRRNRKRKKEPTRKHQKVPTRKHQNVPTRKRKNGPSIKCQQIPTGKR